MFSLFFDEHWWGKNLVFAVFINEIVLLIFIHLLEVEIFLNFRYMELFNFQTLNLAEFMSANIKIL